MLFRIVALCFLLAFAADAEPINANDITVADGDTIDLQGSRYRTVGYDTLVLASPGSELMSFNQVVKGTSPSALSKTAENVKKLQA